jgi:hypothetical protein
MAAEVMSTVSMINDPNVDLIERANVYMAYIPSRDDIVGQMRPWISEFCPDVDSFGMPKGPQHVWTRVKANFSRFHMNYAAITCIVALWSLVSHNPFLLVCIAFVLAVSYLGWMNAEASIRTYMSYRSVKWCVVCLLLLFTALIILSVASWLTVSAGIVVTIHAIFRDEKLLPREGSATSGVDDPEAMGKLMGEQSGDSDVQRRK